MLQADQVVRPDSITRSGIVQPYGVRAESPVNYARGQIDAFVNAVRDTGSQMVNMDGFGIHSIEQVPTLGEGTDESFFDKTWVRIGLAFLAGGVVGYAISRHMGR